MTPLNLPPEKIESKLNKWKEREKKERDEVEVFCKPSRLLSLLLIALTTTSSSYLLLVIRFFETTEDKAGEEHVPILFLFLRLIPSHNLKHFPTSSRFIR